jgi:RNA polymerase sigma-70 factor (ECF subfamily)
VSEQSDETTRILECAAAGDDAAWSTLFASHRERLRRMVCFRLDRRAQGRIDPSDVLQEAYLEAWRRIAEYLRDPKMPFYLWLRSVTAHKLLAMLRHELGAEMRDPRREVSLYEGSGPETSSEVLADRLVESITGPSTTALRAEMKISLRQALDELEPLDREVLVLRHFEQLNSSETARVLGIEQSATSKRHVRALRRLKSILSHRPGGLEEV